MNAARTFALTCAWLLVGCSSRSPGGTSAPSDSGADAATVPIVVGSESVDPGTKVTLTLSSQDQTEVAAVVAQLAVTASLTASQLQTNYALSHNETLPFDPTTADSLSLIQKSSNLSLDDAALTTLKSSGVVVNTNRGYNTFTDGYADLYYQHLPLFISADSMLDAVHRSYDHILKYLEIDALDPTLVATLAGLQANLPSSNASKQAKADLDVYLAVAAALLNGTASTTVAGGDASMAQTLVDHAIAASGVADITLFGYPRVIDFSTFTPRGHYTDSTLLQQYFRAMIWLGTIDFRLIETLRDGSQVFHRQQFDAMNTLSDLFDDSLHTNWSTLHTTISTLVGADDSMTLDQVPALQAALGVTGSAGLASLDDATIAQAIATGRFGTQQIDSYILMADPHAGTLPLNSSFLLLGQRFTVDSYVLSNVVYDRVNHPGFPERMMPNTLDAAFAALRNDDALPLLSSDLATYGYAPELATIRTAIDGKTSDYWNSSMYTSWLNTLRALSPTPSTASNPAATGLPSVVGTTAWARRTLNTQLGSWAEMRHDNILYVKPAVSTGVMCQFPSAYVEPNVAFWDALLSYSDTGSKLLAGLPASLQTTIAVTLGATHFTNLHDDVTLLRQMAIQQTTGADLTSDQLAFINQAVSIGQICGGGIQANGWYPNLIVLGQPTEYKPTIADVFTDPNSGSVLEIGTGSVNPMVVTVETCMGPRAFVGLSMAYYETMTSNFTRLTDTEWMAMLGTTPAPTRPSWLAPVVAQ